MKEEFAHDFDPGQIDREEKELESLNQEISRLEAQYKDIEHGQANNARVQLESEIMSLKARREKIIKGSSSIGIYNDAILRKVFKDDPEQEDLIQ